MSKIVVREINVSSTSLAMRSLPNNNFADAFKCQLPENQVQDIDSVTRAIFLTMPQWITKLLELRNNIVRPLGLKTSLDTVQSNDRDELKLGTAVGVFEVLDRCAARSRLAADRLIHCWR